MGGLHVQVAKECGSDVDGQAVIDEVCSKQTAEVVRSEPAGGQLGMLDRQGIAQLCQFSAQ
nr:hypothetical protein [Arthrobacter sp. FW305-BF8]